MNNYHKFKVGDSVETAYGAAGKVLEVGKNAQGEVVYTVKTRFGETTYKDRELKFDFRDLKDTTSFDPTANNGRCPVCSTPWTKTSFGSKTWYDCLKCEKKAEDIVNRPSFGLVEDNAMTHYEKQLGLLDDMFDDDDDIFDFFD